jgi:hypothetical protein
MAYHIRMKQDSFLDQIQIIRISIISRDKNYKRSKKICSFRKMAMN